MIYRFTIDGRLPGLNDFKTSARGRPWWASHQAKVQAMNRVSWELSKFNLPKFTVPIVVRFKWIERDGRRDRDNVAGGGAKVILDVLKHMGIIKNDSRRWVMDCRHDTSQMDKERPRIEVEIEEIIDEKHEDE